MVKQVRPFPWQTDAEFDASKREVSICAAENLQDEAAPDVIKVIDGREISTETIIDMRTTRTVERRYVIVTTPGSAPDHFMAAFLAMGPQRWHTPSGGNGAT